MYLKIKEIRKGKKITQEDLAARTGLSVRMIVDYEKPGADVMVGKLINIADALEVPLWDLIGDLQPPATLPQLLEPGEEYNTDSYNNLIATKNKLIEVLEIDIKELRRDKEFLRDLIKSKLFNQ